MFSLAVKISWVLLQMVLLTYDDLLTLSINMLLSWLRLFLKHLTLELLELLFLPVLPIEEIFCMKFRLLLSRKSDRLSDFIEGLMYLELSAWTERLFLGVIDCVWICLDGTIFCSDGRFLNDFRSKPSWQQELSPATSKFE